MISGESEISGRVTFRGLTRANLFRFLASDFSFGFENEKKAGIIPCFFVVFLIRLAR